MTEQLSDDDFLSFLVDGLIVTQPKLLDDQYHQQMWQHADELYEQVRKLNSPTAHLEIVGDNLLAQVPALANLLSDPTIAGAIQSVLGEGAFLHPHNFVHESTSADQPFHQDGNLPWNERGHYRAHRPDWLILFYYPQAVTLDNGPTEVIPGTQYWTTDIEKSDSSWRAGDIIDPDLDRNLLAADDLSERDRLLEASVNKLEISGLKRRFLQVPAGSVVIGNYDLIHRGSRTQQDQSARYMYKFYFARTREPLKPAWNKQIQIPKIGHVREDLQPVVASHWAWSQGSRNRCTLNADTIETYAAQLAAGSENIKIKAAYQLGADTNTSSLDVLLAALQHDLESTRRAAAYGLRLRCDEASDALAQATESDNPSVRRFATFALGAAWSLGAETLVNRLASESDDLARSNAAYALGQIARHPNADIDSMLPALIHRLHADVEPDNTKVAGLPRSTVRQSCAYAILQIAANHSINAHKRKDLAMLLSAEQDRYVIGMLAEALALNSDEASVIRTLASQRWSTLRQIG